MIKAVVGSSMIGSFHLNTCVKNVSIATVPNIYPSMLNGLVGAADMNFPTLIVHINIPTMPKIMTADLGPCNPKSLYRDSPNIVIIPVIMISKISKDIFFIFVPFCSTETYVQWNYPLFFPLSGKKSSSSQSISSIAVPSFVKSIPVYRINASVR